MEDREFGVLRDVAGPGAATGCGLLADGHDGADWGGGAIVAAEVVQAAFVRIAIPRLTLWFEAFAADLTCHRMQPGS